MMALRPTRRPHAGESLLRASVTAAVLHQAAPANDDSVADPACWTFLVTPTESIDAVTIVWPADAAAEWFSGPRSRWGTRIAQAVYQAVWAGAAPRS